MKTRNSIFPPTFDSREQLVEFVKKNLQMATSDDYYCSTNVKVSFLHELVMDESVDGCNCNHYGGEE